jgi:hypothetical protein
MAHASDLQCNAIQRDALVPIALQLPEVTCPSVRIQRYFVVLSSAVRRSG